MANQTLGIGDVANDGTGDTLRAASDKVNDNFLEVYTLLGTGTALTTGLSATATVVTLSSAVGTFTTLTPAASDGTALGSASLEFSDLFLADAAVINLGADQDTTLTHVADTGILLNSTRQLQFGDSGTYIHQSADGVLDLVSDTEIEINATTIDVNGNLDVSGTIVAAGALTAATSITVGSAVLTEAELETLDGITAGTVLASKAIITDSDKDITGGRNITITGALTSATLDISGNVDVDGTLEADAITVDGVTLAETISDTVGAMVGSNTETGITVTYEDGDNTLDFVMGTTQSTITSLTNAALVVGRDADNDIDFATDNNIIFRAAGTDQIKLVDGVLAPVTNNGVDLGTASLEFKDAFFDGTVTSDAFAGPLTGEVTGNAATATILATARTIGGTSFDGSGNIAVALASVGTAVTVADESSDTTCFPLFTTAATGDLPPKSGTNLTFNSSSGLLTATLLAGDLTGDVTGTADVATVATTVTITDNESTNESNALIFTAGGDVDGGNLGLESDGTLTYNPSTGIVTATGFAGALTGNVTGNASGTAATVTGAAQTAITSVGTLTALQVDNLNINGNTISSTAGTDLLITPLSGQQIVLDGTIVIDAGVVTGATSITSTAFVGNLTGNVTGNASGTALTVTQAAQTNITSVGTLTALQIDNLNLNGNTLSSTAGTDLLITPLAGQQIVLDATIIIDAGVVTGATSITSTAFVGDITGDVTGTADEATALTGVTSTAAELNILDASAGNTAVASDVTSSAGAITSNNAKIKHTLTLAGELADDAVHADVVVTSDKCLATSTVIANANLDVQVRIHTVVAGSFKVSITNLSGGALANDSTIILNYTII